MHLWLEETDAFIYISMWFEPILDHNLKSVSNIQIHFRYVCTFYVDAQDAVNDEV